MYRHRERPPRKRRCQNCAYFDKFVLPSSVTGMNGECIRTKSSQLIPLYEDTLAVATDNEGYAASLEVRDTYYCPMWERSI